MRRTWTWLGLLGAAMSFGACTGTIGGSGGDGPGSEEEVEQVADALCVVDTPIRRLTRFEYNNTVRDLLGDHTSPADVLPPEEVALGFDNQSAALTTSDLLIEGYMKVSEDVSERATLDIAAILPDCLPSEGKDCALAFIDDFGTRAFRRPITAEERSRLEALYDWALADADHGAFEDGIQVIIQQVLQSPSFLYRPEFGSEQPVEGDVVQFTSYEMATKLSYMLWNSMPDEELFAAAAADELVTKEQIEAQARRMLADPKARDTIHNFHRQWLLLEHLDTVTKDTAVYPSFSPEMRHLWEEEIQQLIEHVIFDGEGTLKELLTADYSYMNAELAAFYGADVLDTVEGEELQQVSLDGQRRAGILTTAALMATHASTNRSSPVFRGKFVREQLLCDALPLPPNDLEITPPEVDPEKTTKEQFEEIGDNPDCAGCHVLMNPIGFAFEHYDGVGLWRDLEHGLEIDAVGEVVQTQDLDGEYDGAVELAIALADSQQVATCVRRQWFQFSYNRALTENDSCSTEVIDEAFAASGYDIRELLVSLTQTNAFLYRRQVSVAGGDQ